VLPLLGPAGPHQRETALSQFLTLCAAVFSVYLSAPSAGALQGPNKGRPCCRKFACTLHTCLTCVPAASGWVGSPKSLFGGLNPSPKPLLALKALPPLPAGVGGGGEHRCGVTTAMAVAHRCDDCTGSCTVGVKAALAVFTVAMSDAVSSTHPIA